MSYSAADKGKARAIDPNLSHNSQPTALPTNVASSKYVKPQPIPATTLLNVEYPGILSHDSNLEGPSSSKAYSSLDRALSTLHPSTLPPLTSSSYQGLNFLSNIPNEGLKLVECRLGGFGDQHSLGESSSSSANVDSVYRAPLIGEAVPTNNIVIRVVKRTWRQKKRKRSNSTSPAPQIFTATQPEHMDLDPALFAENDPAQADEQVNRDDSSNDKRSRYTGRIKKEYSIQILGLATNTVRFRSMADFAFQPNVSTSDPPHIDPVMSLHKALATMDLSAFQNFRIPPQREDYQTPSDSSTTRTPRSNLHMVPPAFFSRMDVPFNYGFQQTPYSELRVVDAPSHLRKPPTRASFAHAFKRDDLAPGQIQRFVNRVRLSNIAPQQFRPGKDTKVPTKPLQDVVRIQHRCEPKVLARLRELLKQRPIWSRVALKNQLDDAELNELHGYNEKVYYALVGYSMVGGPWRDAIVRFGYDVSKDVASRIYQRIFLRGGPSIRDTRLTAQGSDKNTLGFGEEEDDEEADQLPVARSSVLPNLSTGKERARNTHIFDGISLHRNIGNFHLCDIEDPLIKPFIWRPNDDELPEQSVLPAEQKPLQPMGTEWLRKSWDTETGWYTRRALELIRALLTARFKALADTGKPLEREAVEGIVERLRRRWREEDTAAENKQVAAAVEEEGRIDVDSGDIAIDPALM